ncbi:hypothetical protein OESDEN_01759 [Oesophagostomum dentatum]|uniref:Uncharacterized protein n=1 Tax=Oesophagostomum dentatum TaxID=61180 RepID=A0A0B1TLY3_OESDE|nr:hypothetical protein OESDEN_01759 [Oesophagostomum dentatum]
MFQQSDTAEEGSGTDSDIPRRSESSAEPEAPSPQAPSSEEPTPCSSACKEKNLITAQITPPVTPTATSTPHQTLADALNLMSATQEGDELSQDPALVKPLFIENGNSASVSPSRFPHGLRAAKTRRQLESVEARIRLFGDCSRVEVPSGYTTVETQSGVRLIEGGASIHDASSSPIHLPLGRFLPVPHR